MSKVNTILTKRLERSSTPPKAVALAERSASGNLSGFSGIFNIEDLTSQEKENIENLLKTFAVSEDQDFHKDLSSLIIITSEVKAINNQAAILHGERIKKAQLILKEYQDGAFTTWLIATYGNRQTPYNFLQYYDFHQTLPKALHPMLESMPRQAVYTLASRSIPFRKKEEVVKNYRGQTKSELITFIRDTFPLSSQDKRQQDAVETSIKALASACSLLKKKKMPFVATTAI